MQSARLKLDPQVLSLMLLWFHGSLLPDAPQHGFVSTHRLPAGGVPTSSSLIADLTVRRHVFLFDRTAVLQARALPPLVDLFFPDDHPVEWYDRVQADGALCLAVGDKPPTEYDDVQAMLLDWQVVQVHLAVRGDEAGVWTGPPDA